jgi:putative ABC transport system permease protein
MELKDSVLYAIKNLSTRSLRSWLTIIGMVVAVMALVVILSVTEGFSKDINDQLAVFGPDLMFVYPVASLEESLGGGFAFEQTSGKLFQRDVDDVKGIPGVKKVARAHFGRASLSYKGKNITATVYPMDVEAFDMYPDYMEVEEGRLFQESESRVVVFGADAATDLFGKDKVEVGSVIQMNEKNYRVVGVMKKIGTSLSAADDLNIYLPYDDGKELFEGQILDDEVGLIYIQIDEGFNANEIKESIERKLAANHRVLMDDLDFTVVTSDQVMEIVGNVLVASQAVLIAITLIASAVGAIGISNTMFMNVLERVKEIGILKAVGASRRDILTTFLAESAIIGLAGGFIGLVLGFGLVQIVESFGIPTLVSLKIIVFVFLFSIGTGVVAGFIPSYRAARMSAVDAIEFG